MSVYHVTIAVETGDMPDDTGRQHARQMFESRGLTVVSAKEIRGKDADWKGYTPKAGKPGATLARDGRLFQVWAAAPGAGSVWALPLKRRPEDAPIYLATGKGDRCYPYSLAGDSLSKWAATGEWLTSREYNIRIQAAREAAPA